MKGQGQRPSLFSISWGRGTLVFLKNLYLDLFRKHVQPKSNPIFDRYKFNNEIKGTKTFDLFVTQVRLLARDCSYLEAIKDEMIRDRIVFGVSSEKVGLGYCFTPYQRLWLYNGAPLVAFYDTLGIRRTYSRLKPPASSRGSSGKVPRETNRRR